MKFLAILLCLVTGSALSQPAPDWKVAAEPGKKLVANYETPMKVQVTGANGKPLTGAAVELVGTMIGMDHGEHKWPATMTAPGIYEGKVNFFMIGPWNLEVRVRKNNQSLAKKIRFDVKE
jgi:hypothetical protein